MQHVFRAFFRRLWTSIAHPSRYGEFLKQPTFAAVQYLYGILTLTLFATMLALLIGFFFSLPFIRQGLAALDRDLPTLYPEELVVTIKEGSISTNVQEPYFIDLPRHWQTYLERERDSAGGPWPRPFPKHFITFDASASAEEYSPEESLLLITRKSIVMPDRNLGYRVIRMNKADQEFTIDREMYDRLASVVLRFLQYVPAALTALVIAGFLLFPFLGALFTLLGYLLYLLFLVLAVWLLAVIMGKKAEYWMLYRLSLYGITPSILLTYVAGWIPVRLPWLFTILFLVWMGIVLRHMPKQIVSHNRPARSRA